MSNERIEKCKSAIEAADHISAEKKAELMGLLTKLNQAIADASQTHGEAAQNIADSIEASIHEATRKEKRSTLLAKILRELKQSVEKFEASHPDLVKAVLEYSTVL